MTDQNFIDTLSRLLGIKTDEIKEKLADLDVDDMLDLVDASNHGDADRARTLLDIVASPQDEASEEKDEIDDHETREDVDGHEDDLDVEAEDDAPINPLLAPDEVTDHENDDDDDHDAVDEGADEDRTFGIGDKVRMGGRKGVVKNPNGPGDTVGVLIDGEHTMADRRHLQRDRTDESVIGMTPMVDLNRMRALAGLPVSTTPLGPGAVATEIEGPPAPAHAASVAVSPAPPPVAPAAAVPAAGSESPHYRGSPCLDFGGVLQSFDEIEAALPELRVRDAKTVRERISGILQKLNENVIERRLKPGTRIVGEDAVPPRRTERRFFAEGYKVGREWNDAWKHTPRGPENLGEENARKWRMGWIKGRTDTLSNRISDLTSGPKDV